MIIRKIIIIFVTESKVKLMLRAIKYELNPTKTQKTLIRQSCGCCRKVYNVMLDRKISAYQKDGKKVSTYDLMKELVPRTS